MKNDLVRSAVDGFLGSFKLAAMIVVAIASALSVFVNEGKVHDHQPSNSKLHP
jgi:uncharacterized membrane protein YraQ (UPF0718 family)